MAWLARRIRLMVALASVVVSTVGIVANAHIGHAARDAAQAEGSHDRGTIIAATLHRPPRWPRRTVP